MTRLAKIEEEMEAAIAALDVIDDMRTRAADGYQFRALGQLWMENGGGRAQVNNSVLNAVLTEIVKNRALDLLTDAAIVLLERRRVAAEALVVEAAKSAMRRSAH